MVTTRMAARTIRIEAIGRLIHSFMSNSPLPEIPAVIEIEAAHVVDLPRAAPAFEPAGAPVQS